LLGHQARPRTGGQPASAVTRRGNRPA
jgi:hypothetical protein